MAANGGQRFRVEIGEVASVTEKSQTREQADRLWQEWCDRFDRVYRDVQTMFHDRHVWKNLIAMLEQNSNLGYTAVVKNWIIRSYVDRQCSAIRRLNDPAETPSRSADAFPN